MTPPPVPPTAQPPVQPMMPRPPTPAMPAAPGITSFTPPAEPFSPPPPPTAGRATGLGAGHAQRRRAARTRLGDAAGHQRGQLRAGHRHPTAGLRPTRRPPTHPPCHPNSHPCKAATPPRHNMQLAHRPHTAAANTATTHPAPIPPTPATAARPALVSTGRFQRIGDWPESRFRPGFRAARRRPGTRCEPSCFFPRGHCRPAAIPSHWIPIQPREPDDHARPAEMS